MLGRAALLALLFLIVPGCGKSFDVALWDCQLEVQKDNAGRSPEATAERVRDIDACMLDSGYERILGDSSCRLGAVSSACYRKK